MVGGDHDILLLYDEYGALGAVNETLERVYQDEIDENDLSAGRDWKLKQAIQTISPIFMAESQNQYHTLFRPPHGTAYGQVVDMSTYQTITREGTITTLGGISPFVQMGAPPPHPDYLAAVARSAGVDPSDFGIPEGSTPVPIAKFAPAQRPIEVVSKAPSAPPVEAASSAQEDEPPFVLLHDEDSEYHDGDPLMENFEDESRQVEPNDLYCLDGARVLRV